jgi:hypothetical protein
MSRRFLCATGCSLVVAMMSIAGAARAESPITVTIDPAAASKEPIAPEFIGVSYETQMVLPDSQGRYYFTPDNKNLVAMFRTLGIKSLRVGGNTADRPTVNIPAPADLDQLFAFAKAADVKLIYTLRMREGDPKAAADTAKYIMDHYKDRLTCFAIGNEPNVFATEYPAYLKAWKDYAKEVTAVVPGAKFCGPSATPGKANWAKDFVNDMAGSGLVTLITQHDYPGNSARKVTDPAAARIQMLSPDWVKYNEKFAAKFVPAVEAKKLPFRLEEANSFFHGGAKDVSDTLASALWALDYMYWWASHGCSGINFHTGDSVAAGEQNAVCRYAAFTSTSSGYEAHPIAYALKAFDLSGHGKLVPVKITSNDENLNLRGYATIGGGPLTVILINKEVTSGRDAKVRIESGGEYDYKPKMSRLIGQNGDVAATKGITFGGAEITADGQWKGNVDFVENVVTLPAASAAIVELFGPK